MTAFAYLRKSSVRNPETETSHETQESAVRELAKRYNDNGKTLTILSDWDVSGRLGADKRPGYRALLEAIASGQCTAVYSYSLSRLGRSLPELARLIEDCDKRGIPVRLYADSVDTSTASGRLLANVLGSVAAFEADVAGERTRASNAAKLARGQSLRTVPYFGDKPGEDAAAVLAAFRETGSFTRAAALLTKRGVKPRNSNRGVWWASAVRGIVHRLDPAVANRPKARGYKAGGTDFALARLLRCPTCDAMLTGSRDRLDAPHGPRIRYGCRNASATPHPRAGITEWMILAEIREEVAMLRTPDQVKGATDTTGRSAQEGRRLRIIDLFADGLIDKAERDRRLAKVTEVLAKLDARQTLQAVPTIDWSWSPRSINRVLRAIFDSIELDPVTFLPVRYGWSVPEWRR